MVKSPSISWYLKKATGVDFCSNRLKHVVASELFVRHWYEIAKVKQSDPYCQYLPLESICKSINVQLVRWGLRLLRTWIDFGEKVTF
ncbi:hypothetical protein GBA52_015816 [Prunus armeniaca]|nr:hypothetical protein GBA52_015816 [Prunus armeniaca]